MSRVRILSVLALAAFAAACDLNPQPLPPGDQPDGSLNDNGGGGGSTSNPGTGSSSGSSSGGSSSSGGGVPAGDAGVFASDAGNLDSGIALDAADGSLDGGSDATLDAESDAWSDAADASDAAAVEE